MGLHHTPQPHHATPPHRYTSHPTPPQPTTHTSTHHTPHPTPLVGENLSCASEFALRFSIDHFMQFMTKKTFLARRKANLLVIYARSSYDLKHYAIIIQTVPCIQVII